jgi:alpha-beta hydrolase superfamily lysophospholipase
MIRRTLSGFRLLLALVGLVAVVLGVMLSVPVVPPPLLASIETTARSADRSGMPELQRFQARDGTWIAYRTYSASGERVAILVHGSSASSASMHNVAKALSASGISSLALDVRGHGQSGSRGEIGYVGQLEDDLADFLDHVAKEYPQARLMLVGHSSGGGFALRVAAGPLGARFERFILLAPYLGPFAPTTRPDSGGWANASVPRLVALGAMHRAGLKIGGDLPVLAFAVGPNGRKNLTSQYSFNLFANYRTADYAADFANAAGPVALLAGANDELMWPEKFADVAVSRGQKLPVTLVPGSNHMGITIDAPALDALRKVVTEPAAP